MSDDRDHADGALWGGSADLTVLDEPARIDWAALDARLAKIENLFAHADTCPCAHCQHARACTPDPAGSDDA